MCYVKKKGPALKHHQLYVLPIFGILKYDSMVLVLLSLY